MKKRIIPVVFVAVIAALIFTVFLRRWSVEESGHIRFSGNIELTEVKISFKTAGRMVELFVKEGDPVKRGMLLARLDRTQLLAQRAAQEAALVAAQSQLVQLQTAVAYQRESLEGAIAAGKAELSQTEARLRELLAGARPQEIQEARAAVEAARTASVKAASDWSRAQTLYKNDDISAAQYDQFRAANDSAAAILRQAEQRLALVLEGPRKETIEAARAQTDRARAALQVTESGRLELKRREQEADARRADIQRAKAQLAAIDSQLDDTELYSPLDAVVLVKSAEPGETIAAGSTIITLGDLDHPWLRGYINETQLGRLQLGSSVRVTTDSYPGKTYEGRLSFISSEAEFTPKQIQTPEERVKLVYRIKVDIPNPARELKLNMPADAEILLNGSPGR